MVDHLVENWAEKLVAKSVGTMGILRAASMVFEKDLSLVDLKDYVWVVYLELMWVVA